MRLRAIAHLPIWRALSANSNGDIRPAFRWVNTMLGNIKCAITGTYRALRKKHMVRYLAEFEWRFNHRFDLAAMIPALGRAAVATKPQPYWGVKRRAMVRKPEAPCSCPRCFATSGYPRANPQEF